MLSGQPKRKYSQQEINEAPDAITIKILDFRLPELKDRKMFCSRIVRAEYESRKTFLADKYSEYFIELSKLDDFLKAELPVEYHDLFDICCVFRAKIKEHEEVIRMQAIANPTALELSKEAKKVTKPSEFVNTTLDRRHEALQLSQWIMRERKIAAEKAAKKRVCITQNGQGLMDNPFVGTDSVSMKVFEEFLNRVKAVIMRHIA